MKKLVIVGHGTGGTIIATKMRQILPEREWEITVIDKDWEHHYQPGWLFIPFGIYTREDCVKPRTKFVPAGVNFVMDDIVAIDPEKKQVKTKQDTFPYDWLVVATGCRIAPEEVETALELLSARGLFISTHCDSEEQARALLRHAEKWSHD